MNRLALLFCLLLTETQTAAQEKLYGVPQLKELAAASVVKNNLYQNHLLPHDLHNLIVNHIRWKNAPSTVSLIDLKLNQADFHPEDAYMKGTVTQDDGAELLYIATEKEGKQYPLPTNGNNNSVHAIDWNFSKIAYLDGNNLQVGQLETRVWRLNSRIPHIRKLLWSKKGTELLAFNTQQLWLIRLSQPVVSNCLPIKEAILRFRLPQITDFVISDSGNIGAAFEESRTEIELINLEDPQTITTKIINLSAHITDLYFETDNELLVSFRNEINKIIFTFDSCDQYHLSEEYSSTSDLFEIIKQVISISERYLFLRVFLFTKHFGYIYDRAIKKRLLIENAQLENPIKTNFAKTKVYGSKIGDSLIRLHCLTDKAT